MLADPKWDRLPSFKAFIEKQNPEDRYPYTNSQDCACARYLKDANEFSNDWLGSSQSMSNLNALAMGPRGEPGDFGALSDNWTFGKLLDRVNAKIKELEPA